MWRIIRVLFYLVVLAAIGLVLFAYIGPLLGYDFKPPVQEIHVPVSIDNN